MTQPNIISVLSCDRHLDKIERMNSNSNYNLPCTSTRPMTFRLCPPKKQRPRTVTRIPFEAFPIFVPQSCPKICKPMIRTPIATRIQSRIGSTRIGVRSIASWLVVLRFSFSVGLLPSLEARRPPGKRSGRGLIHRMAMITIYNVYKTAIC